MGDVKTWTLESGPRYGDWVSDGPQIATGEFVRVVPEADYLAVVRRAERAEQSALTAFAAIAAAEERRDTAMREAGLLLRRALAAEAERDRLREALAWYADKRRWSEGECWTLPLDNDGCFQDGAEFDNGATARAALGVSDEQ